MTFDRASALTTIEMAKALAISENVFRQIIKQPDSPFVRGVHYVPRTPARVPQYLWDKHATLATWARHCNPEPAFNSVVDQMQSDLDLIAAVQAADNDTDAALEAIEQWKERL